MSSAAAASIKAFGLDRGLPFPLADIARADTILLVGSNLAETMPPVMQYFQEQSARGGSLIVADPRATPTPLLPHCIFSSHLVRTPRSPTVC
jgi:assimilatory nitrate reductase catalytic subunit